MALDKRCIFALSEEELNDLDKFCDTAKIKKSKFLRTIVQALKGLQPESQITEMVLSDGQALKSIFIYGNNNNKGVVEFSDHRKSRLPIEINFKSDGNGNVVKTRKTGGK